VVRRWRKISRIKGRKAKKMLANSLLNKAGFDKLFEKVREEGYRT